MTKKSLNSVNLENKRIFLRADFNVPIQNNQITCYHKLISTLPTIRKILSHNIKQLIIGTHIGRPVKREASLSVALIKEFLEKELNILFTISELKPFSAGKYILLENLRFFPEETGGYGTFFTDNADLMVVDCFGCSHRDDKSITATGLPAVMGLLMERELKMVEELKEGVDLAIFGGAKVSDKLKLINGIKAKKVYLVGKLCFTALKDEKKEFNLPCDFLIKEGDNYFYSNTVKEGDFGVDIGEETIKRLKEDIMNAKSIFWNGPIGLFENKNSERGTKEVAVALKESKAKSFIGGGETVSAALKYCELDDFYCVSTGGGALMAYVCGNKMPGIEIIDDE